MTENDYILYDRMTSYLKDRDVSFDEEGFPILPSSCYSRKEPESIVPWNHRNAAKDKENTALCFFMNDKLLYPRFNTIKEDAEKLISYSSFISMDVTVSRNMPVEVQEFNMRLNALYSAVLALKRDGTYIPSLRCGGVSTLNHLNRYRNPPFVAFGMHGCFHSDDTNYDSFLLRSKLMMVWPGKALLYGKPTKRDIEDLNDLGIPYRIYPDFRTSCKEKRHG